MLLNKYACYDALTVVRPVRSADRSALTKHLVAPSPEPGLRRHPPLRRPRPVAESDPESVAAKHGLRDDRRDPDRAAQAPFDDRPSLKGVSSSHHLPFAFRPDLRYRRDELVEILGDAPARPHRQSLDPPFTLHSPLKIPRTQLSWLSVFNVLNLLYHSRLTI